MENANDPWEVKASKSTVAKDGIYIAVFLGVEEFLNPKLDGPRWKWVFKVSTGPEAGKEVDTLTEKSITPTVEAGRMVEGLLGRKIQVGDKVQDLVNSCKGKKYQILVKPGPKGGKSAVRHVEPLVEPLDIG